MSDNQLSRRQVLGALATTGGAGAIVGTGTGALFSDEETFTDNGIRASTSVAGTVDIEIDATVPDDGSGVTYQVELPDEGNNNPAYIWLATTCPTPEDLGLATEIAIRVTCNGETRTIASGLASHVLNDLRFGVPLCNDGDDACLQVDEKLTVTIEVTDTTSYDGSSDDDTLTFDIELSGMQCRYNADNENPFDTPLGAGKCTQEISYVAFCAEGSTTAPEVTVTDISGTYPPTSVDWEVTNGVPVDYVVVRTGEGGPNEPYTVYDYSPGGETSGTAAVGDRFAAFVGTANEAGFDGCPNSGGNVNSCPCRLAKDAVGDTSAFEGTSTKLEADPGDLKP